MLNPYYFVNIGGDDCVDQNETGSLAQQAASEPEFIEYV